MRSPFFFTTPILAMTAFYYQATIYENNRIPYCFFKRKMGAAYP